MKKKTPKINIIKNKKLSMIDQHIAMLESMKEYWDNNADGSEQLIPYSIQRLISDIKKAANLIQIDLDVEESLKELKEI